MSQGHGMIQSPEPHKLRAEAAHGFGRYRILRPLAFGGMAQILLAIDSRTGSQVVLKQILPQFADNQKFLELFLHEGRLGLRLKHENLVETLATGQVDGAPYIVLEYLRGQPVIELLRAAARAHVELPLGAAVRMVADSARGLQHAHSALDDTGAPLGIVHRDVSPHNLFVSCSGATKVLDFGIAKATSQRHQSRLGTIKGKFAYLAPEQIEGRPIDHRVDVFALGIVLHELLTLKPLFRGASDGETLHRVLTLEVPPPERIRPGVPPGLGAVALRALHRDPDRRLPSAQALADAIEAVAQAECIDASTEVVADLLAELCPATDPHLILAGAEYLSDEDVLLDDAEPPEDSFAEPAITSVSPASRGAHPPWWAGRAGLLVLFSLLLIGLALGLRACHG